LGENPCRRRLALAVPNKKLTSMSIPSGKILAHYEIVSPLGAGGMGKVYLARDTQRLELA